MTDYTSPEMRIDLVVAPADNGYVVRIGGHYRFFHTRQEALTHIGNYFGLIKSDEELKLRTRLDALSARIDGIRDYFTNELARTREDFSRKKGR